MWLCIEMDSYNSMFLSRIIQKEIPISNVYKYDISNPNPRTQLLLTCEILQVQSATLSSERLADGLALVLKLGEGRTLLCVCWSVFILLCWHVKFRSRQGGIIIIHEFIVLRLYTGVTYFGVVITETLSASVQYVSTITRGFQRLPIF
jgi:hypothetical protein